MRFSRMKKYNLFNLLLILCILCTFFQEHALFAQQKTKQKQTTATSKSNSASKNKVKSKDLKTKSNQNAQKSTASASTKVLDHAVDQQEFETQMKSLIKQLGTEKVSIYAVKLPSEEIIFEHQPNLTLHPASNTKIITTGVALNLLSEDFSYQSEWATTQPEGRKLSHLYWKANGDSHLLLPQLKSIAKQIKENAQNLNIQEFGHLIIDAQNITLDPPPGFEDKANDDSGYRAPTGPVTVEFNKITIDYTADQRVGEPVRIEIKPSQSYVRVINQSKIVQKGPVTLDASVTQDPENPNKSLLTVKGNLPVKSKITVQKRIYHPLHFVHAVLKELLQAEGILLRGDVRLGSYPPKGQILTLASYQSQKLPKYLNSINQYSNNLIAEQLLLTLAKEKRGEGSWGVGKKLVTDFLEDNLKWKDFVYDNGSGLFAKTRFSAKQFVSFLIFMQNHPKFDIFYESLAQPGHMGTLEYRLKDLPANVFHGKTGTLNQVSSITGYLDQIAFAILINDVNDKIKPKKIEDQMIRLFYFLNRAETKSLQTPKSSQDENKE
jgi:D-alanyl-D-alanine carboxypeptidase/D-alanyl-D-alanine-endopeptidase (penicillin-binding protein 4)